MKRSLLLIFTCACLPLGLLQGRQTPAAPLTVNPAAPARRNSAYDDAVAKARALAAQKEFKSAATASDQAIQMDDKRWEGYVVAAEAYSGQQLYDDAIGMLQMALVRAPADKKPAVRDAITETRKLLAGATATAGAPSASSSAPAITPAGNMRSPTPAASVANPGAAPTQAEIILWKSIENSKDASDYQAYLDAYPNGVYAPLANRRVQNLSQPTIDAAKSKDRVKGLLLWVQQNGLREPNPYGSTQDITTVNGCIMTSVFTSVNKKGTTSQSSTSIDFRQTVGSNMQILPVGNVWSIASFRAGGYESIFFGDRATASEALDKLVEASDLCHQVSGGSAPTPAASPAGARPSVQIGPP